MKKSQNGFVLISVLLITTISTVYAFSEIKGSKLQERIGGNQQKEINARLMAEKGIFESFKYIKQSMSNGLPTTSIKNAMNEGTTGLIDHDELKILIYGAEENGNIFTFKSKGMIGGAEAIMFAEIDAGLTLPPNPWGLPIVGCEGVGLYNGTVDSYNGVNALGPYRPAGTNGPSDPGNIGDMGDIATISSDGDVLLNAGTVNGSITSNGSIAPTQYGSSPTINGNLTAQNNITTKEATVNGNVNAKKVANITGGAIDGNLNSGENLIFSGTPTVSEYVSHGGTLSDPTYDFASLGVSAAAKETPPPTNHTCDPKGIANVVEGINTDINKPTSLKTISGPSGSKMTFTQSSGAQIFDADSTDPSELSAATSGVMDLSVLKEEGESLDLESEIVYALDSLELVNTKVEIDGHVTLIIEGDVSLFGGSSGFVFAPDKEATSSLTIITKGKVTIGSSSTIFPNAASIHNDTAQRAPLSIYSSYDSGSGVREDAYNSAAAQASQNVNSAFLFAGNSEMYAKIYAPLGYANIVGSGALMGAVRGKAVDVKGGGGIHYDEALGRQGTPPPPPGSGMKFLSAFYIYQ